MKEREGKIIPDEKRDYSDPKYKEYEKEKFEKEYPLMIKKMSDRAIREGKELTQDEKDQAKGALTGSIYAEKFFRTDGETKKRILATPENERTPAEQEFAVAINEINKIAERARRGTLNEQRIQDVETGMSEPADKEGDEDIFFSEAGGVAVEGKTKTRSSAVELKRGLKDSLTYLHNKVAEAREGTEELEPEALEDLKKSLAKKLIDEGDTSKAHLLVDWFGEQGETDKDILVSLIDEAWDEDYKELFMIKIGEEKKKLLFRKLKEKLGE